MISHIKRQINGIPSVSLMVWGLVLSVSNVVSPQHYAKQKNIPAAYLTAIGIVIVGLTAITPHDLAAKSIGDMFQTAENDAFQLTGFMSISLYIVGLTIAAFGITKLSRIANAPNQSGIGGPIASVLVGVALIGLPFIIDGIIDTTGSSQTTTVGKPKI